MNVDIKDIPNKPFSRNYLNYKYNQLPDYLVTDADVVLKEGLKQFPDKDAAFKKEELIPIGDTFKFVNEGFADNKLWSIIIGFMYIYGIHLYHDLKMPLEELVYNLIKIKSLIYSEHVAFIKDMENDHFELVTYMICDGAYNYRYKQAVEWLKPLAIKPEEAQNNDNVLMNIAEKLKANDDEVLGITKVIDDGKSLYIKTSFKDYKDFKIDDDAPERILYNMFNCQLLTRSTCLISIIVYSIISLQIPNKLDLIDLYAISHSYNDFCKYIKDKFKKIDKVPKLETLTYQIIMNTIRH
jgi:hypothetical protein